MLLEKREKLDGWFNIDKPKGVTSAYVVGKIRYLLSKTYARKVRVGHCGTLDPMATGVLPIAIGEATKLAQYIVDRNKEYAFTVQFGQSTDTGDADGKVTGSSDQRPTTDEILSVLPKLVGTITQLVPEHSAAKHQGVPFYKMARAGISPPKRYKTIEISSLNLLQHDLEKSQATFSVTCSKGSYVRSIAQDIASYLKTLCFVIELRRLSVGSMSAEDSLLLADFQSLPSSSVAKLLIPMETLISHIPSIDISLYQARDVMHGKVLDIANQGHGSIDPVWLKYGDLVVSIGKLQAGKYFISSNFNYPQHGF